MQNRTKLLALASIAVSAIAIDATPASAQAVSAEETYRLVQVSGTALPALVEADDDGCREEILAGTLTLETDGDWELTLSERETCGDDVEQDEDTEEGEYRVEGSTIRFVENDDDDDDDAEEDGDRDLDDLATGTRTGDGLTVTLGDGETVLRVRR